MRRPKPVGSCLLPGNVASGAIRYGSFDWLCLPPLVRCHWAHAMSPWSHFPLLPAHEAREGPAPAIAEPFSVGSGKAGVQMTLLHHQHLHDKPLELHSALDTRPLSGS